MTTTTYHPTPVPAAPLWTRGRRSPLRELVRFRLSHIDHMALVLVETGGRAGSEPSERLSLLKALTGGYEEAYLVDTGPRTGVWQLPVGAEPAMLEITWWVADPARAVLSGPGPGDPWATVSGHLDRLLQTMAARARATGQDLTPHHVAQYLSRPQPLEGTGLACCAETTAPAFELPGAAGGGDSAPPQLWSPQRREEYEFYLQAVRTGPDALAALWLLHHPNEVRHVLEWVTDHPRTAEAPPPERDVIYEVLDRLSAEEREQLAKVVVERIYAMTAPEGPEGEG
ncbi:hypothetical protein [Streptomyces roseifaciens]|uniref:hypothetical protein n=1 Tax=Streptomyces roseifaciens TaxID=1488406 RepID=UPI0007180786|nr:hypothetical protein [Streptomyces roseifaciens]